MKKKVSGGMTMIEMLIVLTISVVVFWVSTSMVTGLFYSDERSKQEQLLDRAKDQLEQEFGERVRWAKEIEDREDGVKLDGVNYQLRGGRIMKEGKAITPDRVVVEAFEIENLSTDSHYQSLEIKVEMRDKMISSVHDSMRMVVSQRKTAIGGENG